MTEGSSPALLGPAFGQGTVGLFTGFGRGRGLIDQFSTDDVPRVLQSIVEAGFAAAWIPEAIGREVFSHAALLLSANPELSIGTGIASIYARDAVAANAGQRLLDAWFPGRFVLGLGVSHRPAVEGLRGHTYDRPLAAMSDYLDRMDSALHRAPESAGRPPRLLAALGDHMLKLAATRADGAHPYFVPPAHTAHARRILGPDRFLAPGLAVYLDDDVERGVAAIAEYTAFYLALDNYRNNLLRLGYDERDLVRSGSHEMVTSIVAIGTADDINRRIDEHFAAGATHIPIQVLSATGDDPNLSAVRDVADALSIRARQSQLTELS